MLKVPEENERELENLKHTFELGQTFYARHNTQEALKVVDINMFNIIKITIWYGTSFTDKTKK